MGQHDYAREDCYSCSQRVECMLKKFQDKKPCDDWGDGDKPNCFGSYKGKADCGSCGYRKECSGISKDLLKGKIQKRHGGKYKSRGKEIERDIY